MFLLLSRWLTGSSFHSGWWWPHFNYSHFCCYRAWLKCLGKNSPMLTKLLVRQNSAVYSLSSMGCWNEYLRSGRCICKNIRLQETVGLFKMCSQKQTIAQLPDAFSNLVDIKPSFGIIWKLLSLYKFARIWPFWQFRKNRCDYLHEDMLHSCGRTKCCFQFYKNLQLLIMITRVSHGTCCNQKCCTFAPMMQPQVLGWCVTLVYSGFTRFWDLESKGKFPPLSHLPNWILSLYFSGVQPGSQNHLRFLSWQILC